ncbi:OmpH family outer membrane protein [Rickettsiales bacterium]|nr:OmpH family outer membrane protein [Rickettsiales bacterium]
MRYLLYFITVLFIFNATANASNIAVVDIKAIMEGSKAAEDVRNQIKKSRNKYQSEIAKKEETLRQDDQKLAKLHSTLSPEAFEAKKKEFKEKLIEVQRDVQIKRSKLDTALTKALETIQETILSIVEDLAKEKKFDLALPNSQVLYSDESLDITQEVLDLLNKKLPKVKISIDK